MMNEFEQLIVAHKGNFNKNEESLVKLLLENQEFIANNNLTNLAKKCYTSPASLHRVIKKLDFQGYGEFKFFVKKALQDSHTSLLGASVDDYQSTLFSNIEMTLSMNEAKIEYFLKLLQESEHTYCYGTGWKQKNVARSFSHDLLYYQKKAFSLRNEGDLRILSNQLTDRDLVIIISLNGNPDSYQDVLDYLKLNNTKIISVTSDNPNPLMSLSDLNLMYKDSTIFTGKHWQCMTLSILMDYLLERYYSDVFSVNQEKKK